MQSKASLESLSTAYFTIPDSELPTSLSPPLASTGPLFLTSHTTSGKIVNVAGDYFVTTGSTVTYPPDRANHAPTGAITRHFVGRADELRKIRCGFDLCRVLDLPAHFALYGAPGVGKSQLALQFSEHAYARGRYSHIFHISASSPDQIREGLAHVLRLVHPSNYKCAESVEAHEARRWLEDAHPGIAWLLILDSAVLDSVNYLRTHLPRKNMGGDILFVAQSEVVAKALADEGRSAVLNVGPLAWEDAAQLLLKKAGVESSAESIEEARSIVELLDCLPIPICQAASFAKHFQGGLGCLTRLLQGGQLTRLLRWDTRLTSYERTTFASMVQSQLAILASNRPQAAELLKVLCYLHPSGISLPILVDGARLLHSTPTTTSKLSKFMSQSRSPQLSPSDLDHPLRALLSTIALQDELYNIVRCLQHISLVRLETVHPASITSNADPLESRSSHILRIPDLVRKIVRVDNCRKDEQAACFGMTVGIIVSAFVQCRHDSSLWSPFIKHITSLSRWDWEFLQDDPQGRLNATFRAALNHAIKIIAGFDRKIRKILERKVKTDKQLFQRHIKHSLAQCGF